MPHFSDSFEQLAASDAPVPSLILDLCHGLSYSAGDCRNASVALSEDGTELSGFVDSKGDYSSTVGRRDGVNNGSHLL